MITDSDLGPAQRAEALGRLATEEFDVLVLGAGVVGAGAALDAATRGLSVALGGESEATSRRVAGRAART